MTTIHNEQARALLKANVLNHMPEPGDYASGLEGVRTYRHDKTSELSSCFYRPLIVYMVQGCKRALMGTQVYRYGEDDVLVTGVDMPGASMICEASSDSPSLSLSIDLDKNLLGQLALEMAHKLLPATAGAKGILVQDLDAELFDAFCRLVGLFATPDKLSVLGPMIVREIHFLLLLGPNGHHLRSFFTLGSQANQIAQAINWLKKNFSTPIQVEELADKVHMAISTFHRHFKEVTTLSPLQYQKRLRLHEAQRLMLTQGLDASSASLAVGYESLSQFTREYKRLFGDPPRRDVNRLRGKSPFSSAPRAENTIELQGV